MADLSALAKRLDKMLGAHADSMPKKAYFEVNAVMRALLQAPPAAVPDVRESLAKALCKRFHGDYDFWQRYLQPVDDALQIAAIAPPAAAADVEAKYTELLYAVACKFPNESRHETALRYIRERESALGQAGQAQRKEGE